MSWPEEMSFIANSSKMDRHKGEQQHVVVIYPSHTFKGQAGRQQLVLMIFSERQLSKSMCKPSNVFIGGKRDCTNKISLVLQDACLCQSIMFVTDGI